MINNELKELEKNARKAGLSDLYIASKLIKSADGLEFDELGTTERGFRRPTDVPEGLSIERWDVTQNPNLISDIEKLETTTKDNLVEMFKSNYRDFTEDELRKVYPYIKSKGILFKWICELKNKEYDDIPWEKLVADDAIGTFSPDSTHQEKILAEIESLELQTALDNIEQYEGIMNEVLASGIPDANGQDILQTPDGKELHSYITDFVIENGLVNELAGAVTNGQIGADIQERMLLKLSMQGEDSSASLLISGVSSSSAAYFMGVSAEDGEDLTAGAMPGVYAKANHDFRTLRRFYKLDNVMSKRYLQAVVGAQNIDWEDDPAFRRMALEWWQIKNDTTPYRISDLSTDQEDQVSYAISAWKKEMELKYGMAKEFEAPEENWPQRLLSQDITGGEYYDNNIGVWNNQWPYYNHISQVSEGMDTWELLELQSIEGLNLTPSAELHPSLNMPIPWHTREIGYYLDGDEFRLWVPPESSTLNYTRPSVGTVYGAIHGATANDEIQFESGSKEWNAALDSGSYLDESVYGYAVPSNIPGSMPKWVAEMLIAGKESDLPKTNLLRQSTGIEYLYETYGIDDENKLYNYYPDSSSAGNGNLSEYRINLSEYQYSADDPSTFAGEYLPHGTTLDLEVMAPGARRGEHILDGGKTASYEVETDAEGLPVYPNINSNYVGETRLKRSDDPLFWHLLETQYPEAYKQILSGEESEFGWVESEPVKKALLLIQESRKYYHINPYDKDETPWGAWVHHPSEIDNEIKTFNPKAGYRGEPLKRTAPESTYGGALWDGGSLLISRPNPRERTMRHKVDDHKPGNKNKKSSKRNNVIKNADGAHSVHEVLRLPDPDKESLIENPSGSADWRMPPPDGYQSRSPLWRLYNNPSNRRGDWNYDPYMPQLRTEHHWYGTSTPVEDLEAFDRWSRGRVVYPMGQDPRTYNDGELEYESPGVADLRNQCRSNQCHAATSPSYNSRFRLLYDGVNVGPQTGGNTDHQPFPNQGFDVPYGIDGADNVSNDYLLPVFNIDAGYQVWTGYTPYEGIERIRYAEPLLKEKESNHVSSVNQSSRAVLGLMYDASIPPGMNEVLRATYQKNLVPFYMDPTTPSEFKVSGESGRASLSFETYNMSVPRSMRTLWLVGVSTKEKLQKEFPSSKITIVQKPSEVASEDKSDDKEGEKADPGFSDNDELIVVATTNPGNYRVNYYLMTNSAYTDLLGRYQGMESLRPTLSEWATIAMRSRIESKEPRLLIYYRELERSDNDASILLSRHIHPYGNIRDGAISSGEISEHGARSEWLFDQYFASMTGTSIEMFEQMHTIGFHHTMDKRERKPVIHHSRNLFTDGQHFVWDMAGMLPGVGSVLDITHAAAYFLEGRFFLAGLSLAFAVPIVGDVPQFVMAGGKIAYGATAIKLGQTLGAMERTVLKLHHLPDLNPSVVKDAWLRVINTAKAAERGLPKAQKMIDDLVEQAKNIRRSKVLTRDEAITALGGVGKNGKGVGLTRYNAIKVQGAGDDAVVLLDREARRLAEKAMYGTGPRMAAWNGAMQWSSKIPFFRNLIRGSDEVAEGAFDQAARNVLEEGVERQGADFVPTMYAKNASAIRALGDMTGSAWNLEKHGIRVSAKGRITLDEISEGIKMRYLGEEVTTRTVAGHGGRAFDDAVEEVMGSGYQMRRHKSGKAVKGRGDSAWPGDRMGGTKYWFDDVRYLNQKGAAKWSERMGGVPGFKRVFENLTKFGKGRLLLLGLCTGMMYVSLAIAIRSALKINALLELAITKGVIESSNFIGIGFRETFHNPDILKEKYAELTSGCPGFTLSGDPNVEAAYSSWVQDFLFERVDAWLDDGFFRNLGEEITLDDYSDWKSVQGKAGAKRRQEEAMMARMDKARKEQFTAQWDYLRDCPDGDQEASLLESDPDYKPQCDPSKPEYIGKGQSSGGYSVSLPETNVPDDWYEGLSEPGSNMLGYYETGGDGFFQPKRISKANILAELIAEDPDRIKREIEVVYKSLNSDFDSTVLSSLDTVFQGAHDIDAQCDPFKLLHLLIVSKFARYLTLEDITLKYGKWQLLVDMVSTGAILKRWDHLTWALEIGQAGETVMAEVPKWAAMNADFQALETQICSDSKAILLFVSNFLDMIDYMSTQSEHGWKGNYITEGRSDTIDSRFPDEVGVYSSGNIAEDIRAAGEIIEQNLIHMDENEIDPVLLEGFQTWGEAYDE